MTIKTYYMHNGDVWLSKHFQLSEFQCKDGSDKIIISEELIKMLEKLRSYGNFTISINSGYRTSAYNKKIGGASNSTHCKGYAADVVVKKDGIVIPSKYICCIAQIIGFNGIGKMNTATHLDVYGRTYRGDEANGYSNNVGGDFFKYFGLTKSYIENKYKYKGEDDMTKEEVESIVKKQMDLENPYYAEVQDVPLYWRNDVLSMVNERFILGDGTHNVAMRHESLRSTIISYRMMKAMADVVGKDAAKIICEKIINGLDR